MKTIFAFLSGLIFGLGLIISGMANPAKVQNFLDFFGTWDPSLAFVMGGAIAVGMPGLWLVSKRTKPFFHDVFHLPTQKDIDKPLIIGSALFGIGWGIGGYCPGPAITASSMASPQTLIFVAAMIAGMILARALAMSKAKRMQFAQ